MEATVIRFKKSKLYITFGIGLGTIICGVLSMIYGFGELIGLGVLGAIWIGVALHQHLSGYITLGDDYLLINQSPWTKTIKFSDIKKVTCFAGDWILKYGKDKEIYILPNFVAPDQRQSLENYLIDLRKRHE